MTTILSELLSNVPDDVYDTAELEASFEYGQRLADMYHMLVNEGDRLLTPLEAVAVTSLVDGEGDSYALEGVAVMTASVALEDIVGTFSNWWRDFKRGIEQVIVTLHTAMVTGFDTISGSVTALEKARAEVESSSAKGGDVVRVPGSTVKYLLSSEKFNNGEVIGELKTLNKAIESFTTTVASIDGARFKVLGKIAGGSVFRLTSTNAGLIADAIDNVVDYTDDLSDVVSIKIPNDSRLKNGRNPGFEGMSTYRSKQFPGRYALFNVRADKDIAGGSDIEAIVNEEEGVTFKGKVSGPDERSKVVRTLDRCYSDEVRILPMFNVKQRTPKYQEVTLTKDELIEIMNLSIDALNGFHSSRAAMYKSFTVKKLLTLLVTLDPLGVIEEFNLFRFNIAKTATRALSDTITNRMSEVTLFGKYLIKVTHDVRGLSKKHLKLYK